MDGIDEIPTKRGEKFKEQTSMYDEVNCGLQGTAWKREEQRIHWHNYFIGYTSFPFTYLMLNVFSLPFLFCPLQNTA